MVALLQDVRQALRLVRQRVWFSTLVVLCLALGTGANTAIFSVVNSVLLRPLPYKDPDRLVRLFDTAPGPGGNLDQYDASAQNFLAWVEQAHVFEHLEAVQSEFFNLVGKQAPERLEGAMASAKFFDLLGAKMALGRTFLPEEDRPGGPLAVILGDAFWQQRFSADPQILGRSLVLNGKSYTVVGVLAPGFFFSRPADLWVPLALDEGNLPPPSVHNLMVVARLRSGVTVTEAQAEMDTIASRLSQERPDTNAGLTVKVTSLREDMVGNLRPALLVLFAAVGFVLLIACANVANLLLSRAAERRPEIAVRAALGANRGRLIGQVLTESLVLALLGGVVGFLLALATVRLLTVVQPPEMSALPPVDLDGRVLGFTLLISLLTGLLSGLFPALGATRASFHQKGGLRQGVRSSEGREGRRSQDALVVAEVALALVLLICAGLMLKSFERLNRVSLGFEPRGVLVAPLALPEWKYSSPEQIRGFWRDLLPRVESLPGVVSTGTTHVLPVNDSGIRTPFEVENRPPAAPDEVLLANFRKVSPDLFATLRIPLVAGRLFTDGDDAGNPEVVIISQEMARSFWPEGRALGRRIRRANTTWLTVVGIVADVQDAPLGQDFGNTLYIPLAQNPKSANPMVYLLVRTQGAPEKVADGVRGAILAVDRDQSIGTMLTMEEWISKSLTKRRFDTLLITLFAGLGLFLAAVGIFGVLSYAARKRSHEFGVRIVSGAKAGDILRLVLGQGMRLIGIGLGFGLVLSFIATRLLGGLLYEIQPTDPATFVQIIIALLALALLVSYIPARRAARVDPIVLLKSN
jgi:putative ABC transport system permease protein